MNVVTKKIVVKKNKFNNNNNVVQLTAVNLKNKSKIM